VKVPSNCPKVDKKIVIPFQVPKANEWDENGNFQPDGTPGIALTISRPNLGGFEVANMGDLTLLDGSVLFMRASFMPNKEMAATCNTRYGHEGAYGRFDDCKCIPAGVTNAFDPIGLVYVPPSQGYEGTCVKCTGCTLRPGRMLRDEVQVAPSPRRLNAINEV
jgi:hypothetical protein